jgi:ParB family chromosome partitioning protein
MIITGERRYRAAKMAGLPMVPVVERSYEDDAIHEIALIENIQREDLNPVEEAAAIAFLMRQHDLTQEEVAARLSKSRPAVANTLRLLQLPELIKDFIKSGQLSAGHGRALSALGDPALMERLARSAVESGCSVRAMEQIVKAAQNEAAEQAQKAEAKKEKRQKPLDSDLYEVETRLRETLKTKVKINGSKKRGKITIEYYSMDALQEIYDLILGE